MTNDSKTTDAVNDETPRVCPCCDEPLREDKTEHCTICKGSNVRGLPVLVRELRGHPVRGMRAVERPRRLRLLRELPV